MAAFLPKASSARLGAIQQIAPAGASAASAAFGSQTYQIRVCADAAMRIRIGDGTPTALNTDALLPANWVEYFTVTPGQKLAAFGTGNVTVTEMS